MYILSCLSYVFYWALWLNLNSSRHSWRIKEVFGRPKYNTRHVESGGGGTSVMWSMGAESQQLARLTPSDVPWYRWEHQQSGLSCKLWSDVNKKPELYLQNIDCFSWWTVPEFTALSMCAMPHPCVQHIDHVFNQLSVSSIRCGYLYVSSLSDCNKAHWSCILYIQVLAMLSSLYSLSILTTHFTMSLISY